MEIFITTLPWIMGILGIIVGSFLNVVILRFGKKSINGRSACMQCNHQLRWYELIPIISHLLQRGKCRSCSRSISFQYSLVELGTGILFYLATVHVLYMLILPSVIWWGVMTGLLITVCLSVLLITYDIRYQLVPHVWLLGLVMSSSAYLIFWYIYFGFDFVSSFIYHGIGLIIALPFLFIWIVSKGKWIGFGDILLIGWLGLFFGLWQGINALLIAIYLGGLFGIGMILYKRYKKIPYHEIRKLRIPFVPFLLGAWMLTELLGVNLLAWFL
jgi:prepilin signal peptidase PulO-like enzyme (type II secretory pathway)